MANIVKVINPPPGDVIAGDPIANIQVEAGPDPVSTAQSTVGTFKGSVYTPLAGLTQSGTVFVPDSAVVAETGKFKLRAEVQFTSGGMEAGALVPGSHAGEFDGKLVGAPSGRPRPRPRRTGRPASKREAAAPAKRSKRRAQPARRSAAKPPAKSKAKRQSTTAKKRKPSGKKGAAKRKK